MCVCGWPMRKLILIEIADGRSYWTAAGVRRAGRGTEIGLFRGSWESALVSSKGVGDSDR